MLSLVCAKLSGRVNWLTSGGNSSNKRNGEFSVFGTHAPVYVIGKLIQQVSPLYRIQ